MQAMAWVCTSGPANWPVLGSRPPMPAVKTSCPNLVACEMGAMGRGALSVETISFFGIFLTSVFICARSLYLGGVPLDKHSQASILTYTLGEGKLSAPPPILPPLLTL